MHYYAQVVARLPIAPVWSLLFFIMLLTLGLDSQFALMETITTAILDGVPSLRNYKIWVVLGAAIVGYAGGVIFTTNVSHKRLSFVDTELTFNCYNRLFLFRLGCTGCS